METDTHSRDAAKDDHRAHGALAAVRDVLRAQAATLGVLADAIEADSVAVQRGPDEQHLPGAFGADAAASYCDIGSTLLREQGPPPRYIGGRAVWLRKDLDEWLRQLPAERTHGRGRRRSGGSRDGKGTHL